MSLDGKVLLLFQTKPVVIHHSRVDTLKEGGSPTRVVSIFPATTKGLEEAHKRVLPGFKVWIIPSMSSILSIPPAAILDVAQVLSRRDNARRIQ